MNKIPASQPSNLIHRMMKKNPKKISKTRDGFSHRISNIEIYLGFYTDCQKVAFNDF